MLATAGVSRSRPGLGGSSSEDPAEEEPVAETGAAVATEAEVAAEDTAFLESIVATMGTTGAAPAAGTTGAAIAAGTTGAATDAAGAAIDAAGATSAGAAGKRTATDRSPQPGSNKKGSGMLAGLRSFLGVSQSASQAQLPASLTEAGGSSDDQSSSDVDQSL